MLPKLSCDWEPIELRIMKAKLAKLQCSCPKCTRYPTRALKIKAEEIKDWSNIKENIVLVDWSTQCEFKKECAVNATLDFPLEDKSTKTLSHCNCREIIKCICNSESQTTEQFLIRNPSVEKSTCTYGETQNFGSNMSFFDFITNYSSLIEPNSINKCNTKSRERVTFAKTILEKPTESDAKNDDNCPCLGSFMKSLKSPLS